MRVEGLEHDVTLFNTLVPLNRAFAEAAKRLPRRATIIA
jgi:hypothetical protein